MFIFFSSEVKLNNYNQQPESNNLTLSDDEFVECQSFSNLSNYPRTQQSDVAPSFDSTAKTFDFTKSIVESNLNDVTVSCENVKPVVVEDSFRFAQQQQRQNESYSLDVSLNDRSMNINNTTRNVDDLKDLDRMLFKNLSYQDNVTSERSIEHGNKTVNDIESKFPLEFHHSITEQSLKSTQNDVLIGTNVNPNVTFEQETIQEDLTPATVDNVNMATIMIPTIQIQLVTPQKNSQNTSHEEVENVCSNSGIAEIGIRIKEEFEDAMDVDEQEDVEDNLYITPTKGLKFPFTRLNEVSFGHHSPSTEDIASNVSDTEDEFKMTEQNKSPYDEHDDINDENSNKDELADMFNNTFEKEKVPDDLTLNESPSTMTPVVVANKEKQMNFMDAIGNNFDVEFKVPSLPQSRKSGELCSNYSGMEDVFAGPKVSSDVKEEVFKPAASTCKKKCYLIFFYKIYKLLYQIKILRGLGQDGTRNYC